MKKSFFAFLIAIFLLLSIPVQALASGEGLIRDHAGLLTDNQEHMLESQAVSLTDEYGMDVVILTVESLGGYSAQTYADDYYDSNGFREDGLLLLLAMEEREWYISTCGNAIDAFTDYGLDELGKTAVSYFSYGEYYEGFSAYLEEIPYYFDAYAQGESIDIPSRGFGSIFFVSLLIGLAAAAVVILIMRSSMNTKRRQYSAGDYLKSGSFRLRIHQDVFLYSQVSKTPRQQSSSSGGGRGGSSVHRSSSGRSHGGRGGRF